MWPFKSNTRNETLTVTKKTWLIEAERLEAEAERIEGLVKQTFHTFSVNSGDVLPYVRQAAELRVKALALRIYRGEEPKKEEQTCGGCNVKVTAGAIATAKRAKKPSKKPVKKTTRSRR